MRWEGGQRTCKNNSHAEKGKKLDAIKMTAKKACVSTHHQIAFAIIYLSCILIIYLLIFFLSALVGLPILMESFGGLRLAERPHPTPLDPSNKSPRIHLLHLT